MEKIWGLTDYIYTAERYTIGSMNIELKEKISEGGYAYVFKAVDTNTGQEYAVKKILCQSSELIAMAEREIEVMKSLPIHENIVRYYDSLIINQGNSKSVLIVMELCTGGTLVNLLEKYNRQLSQAQVFFITKEICQAILVIHSAGFVHRDIKIENVLLQNKKFKLCDFGSCSREIYDLASASRNQLLTYQERFERETTLMYRPPEMIDLYQRYTIDFKGDSWMIGCVLFTLAFCKHPFQDQAQLAIVNAHYSFPQNSRFDDKFHGLISWILDPNPNTRPSISEIFQGISNYDNIPSFASVANKPQVRSKKRIDRDLTEEEINLEILRIRNEMEAKEKAKEKPKTKKELNIWEAPAAAPSKNSPNLNMGWAKF